MDAKRLPPELAQKVFDLTKEFELKRKIPTVKIFRKGIVNPLVATWIPDEVYIVDNFHEFNRKWKPL